MNRHFVLSLSVALALAGFTACDSYQEESEETVPGIEVRSESNGMIGLLGDPVTTGPAGGAASLYPPYPNPAASRVTLTYAISRPGPVEVRVERLAPTPALEETVARVLPGFSYGSAAPVRTFPAVERTTGLYEIRWDGADDAGQPAGPGYYRVRLIAGAEVHTYDVIIVGTEDDMVMLRGAARRAR